MDEIHESSKLDSEGLSGLILLAQAGVMPKHHLCIELKAK